MKPQTAEELKCCAKHVSEGWEQFAANHEENDPAVAMASLEATIYDVGASLVAAIDRLGERKQREVNAEVRTTMKACIGENKQLRRRWEKLRKWARDEHHLRVENSKALMDVPGAQYHRNQGAGYAYLEMRRKLDELEQETER